MQPAVFLPHGAPDLALSDIPASRFLRDYFNDRPKPKGIVIVSAHWEATSLQLTTGSELETIHDFGGFGPALHALRYPAKSAPWLIEATKVTLRDAGIAVQENRRRGLDHGAWIPLKLTLPKAEIPIVQLSIPFGSSVEDMFRIGQTLSDLGRQDIQVIGSGATVHNLRFIAPEGSATPNWAAGFDDWLEQVFAAKDWQELFQFRSSEFGRAAHPSIEHFLPLAMVAGACAAQEDTVMRNLHRTYSYGSIGMAAWDVHNAI